MKTSRSRLRQSSNITVHNYHRSIHRRAIVVHSNIVHVWQRYNRIYFVFDEIQETMTIELHRDDDRIELV